MLQHVTACKQKQHPFHLSSGAAAASFCSRAASSSGYTGVVVKELSILSMNRKISSLKESVSAVVFEEVS